jgi:sugar diacid utilization regulator
MEKPTLTFPVIYKSLKIPIVSRIINNEDQTIERVKLYSRNRRQPEPDVLYIGMAKEFTGENTIDINIILCTEDVSMCEVAVSKNSNVILLQSSNIAEVLSDVQDIIYDFHKRFPANEELLKTILENDSIQAVVNKCYSILQNPIVVTDSSFKLLAWTKGDKPVKDSYWNELMQDGYPSISSIIALQKANAYKDFIQPGIIHTENPEDSRKIITRIQDRNTILGYFGILEINREFQEADLEVVQLIVKIMAKMLLYKNVENNKCDNDRYEQLLIDILDHRLKSEKQIKERLPYLKWNFADKYCLLTIDLSEKDNFDTLSCYFKGAVKKLYPSSNMLIYNEHILIIDGVGQNLLQPEEAYLEPIRKLLKKSGLYCGLSNCFTNIAQLDMYYKQSLLAIELGSSLGKAEVEIHAYSDYARMYMIQICKKYEDLRYFYHPAILQLQEYDTEKGTHYIETLEAFLKYNKNSYAAAEAIYVHRNTMIYRINKIKEITGLSFEDKELVDLMMSLEILKYEKSMK